jgi:aminoglycoside phosphotransferase (APT) family kinase protein
VALLAQLHAGALHSEVAPDFAPSLAYAHKLIANLEKYGVLQHDPLVVAGLRRLVDQWADEATMVAYTPALTHGDATTTNFILSPQGDLVAIDWERAKVVDPAADVGRLLAEVLHSITRYGGSAAEALPILARLQDTYCRAMAPACDPESLAARIRFYQASSTLRIARNGWLSRLERTALVAQAMALLG